MRLPWLCPNCENATNPAYRDKCPLCGARRPVVKRRPPTFQDRHPNFRSEDGQLFLVRCFACEPSRGRENHISCVADGLCASCGWWEEKE